jgi:hypothetical protein
LLQNRALERGKTPGVFSQYTLRRSPGVFVAFGPVRKPAVGGILPLAGWPHTVVLWLASLSPTISSEFKIPNEETR